MMKKSRLTRLFSLFAAMLMCVSLLSAVASASDGGIQPHGASCPVTGGDHTYFVDEFTQSSELPIKWSCDGVPCKGPHKHVQEYRVTTCTSCHQTLSVVCTADYKKCFCGKYYCPCIVD